MNGKSFTTEGAFASWKVETPEERKEKEETQIKDLPVVQGFPLRKFRLGNEEQVKVDSGRGTWTGGRRSFRESLRGLLCLVFHGVFTATDEEICITWDNKPDHFTTCQASGFVCLGFTTVWENIRCPVTLTVNCIS